MMAAAYISLFFRHSRGNKIGGPKIKEIN